MIYIMNLQIAKWGNSLALRIPAEIVRRLGLREGATVEAQLSVDGTLSIRLARWNRKAFALELTEARSAMPMIEPVMEELRGGARY
jgi:antitoxin MazE